MNIPIAKPSLGQDEAEAASKVILSGWVTQGAKVEEFEKAFASYVGSEFACAVSSCTAALHIALLAVGVKPGDVVITVSHSFIASANAIRHCGAEPVFIDIDPETFNMSLSTLEKCLYDECENIDESLVYRNISDLARGESPLVNMINKGSETCKLGRVSAVMPVHQMGMPCDLNEIIKLTQKFKIPVVGDAACAVGSEVKFNNSWDKIGKPHESIACFSFHPRKVLTTGDGGMLTTNNPSYDRQFKLLRQHAMSIPDTERHNAKKMIFEEYLTTAFNYRMTDIQAAVGIEQLKKIPEMIQSRRAIDKLYRKLLKDIKWLRLPVQPVYARSNWQSYPARVRPDAPVSRNELMQYLMDNGVSSRPGIMNAHQEKPYSKHNYELPESDKARDEVILFPIYKGLEENDVKVISDLIHKIG
ncbi:MAG: DegT/DnrJ/EryC1/StrS family aminotransferase [Lentimicrobiaceae bacterium]|jgi:perosamine synthetase|nr:DegT/DnrJ/EryC1/StrS family aminotransferase [Candidatus Scalindua sp.]MBT6671645.1 DegT/DnrJ/EryC1/StrS family aminotransferase [Lentimicrobiaceae bacterium]